MHPAAGGGYPPQHNSHLMQPHFANYAANGGGRMPNGPFGYEGGGSQGYGNRNTNFSPAADSSKPPQSAAAPKSDQPMVTIKRVMRPDTNEPTVTISVKKDEHNQMHDKEKVLFTLINGQVMKTGHAPDNLIPSAKPLPRDLARQVLPEELHEATLTKNQRRKLKKKAATKVEDEVTISPVSAESMLSSNLQRLNLAARGPSAPGATINFTSGQMPAAHMPRHSRPMPPLSSYGAGTGSAAGAGNRVPLNSEGHVDLQRLSLPDGISISKISGPVPDRKYFPSKPGPEQETNSRYWPHQQQGFQQAAPFSAAAASAAMNGGSAEAAMYANDPNVIVVDTNKLPTREEEEKSKKHVGK
jgi:hypothetical protein